MSPTRDLERPDSFGGVVARLEAKIEAVHRGDFSVASELGLPEDHALSLLGASIVDMATALSEAKARREQQEQRLERQLYVIQSQAAAIAELSCPVIEVWGGVLTLPIVGTMSSERATSMTRNLLEVVARLDTELVIVDLTGVHDLGTEGCDHILRMARCVGLLGSRCAISGVRPRVAQLIVELDSDLGGVRCFTTLRAALSEHVSGQQRQARLRARPHTDLAPPPHSRHDKE